MNPITKLKLWWQTWLRKGRLRKQRERRAIVREIARMRSDIDWATTPMYHYSSQTWKTMDAEGNVLDSGTGEPPFEIPEMPGFPVANKPKQKTDDDILNAQVIGEEG